MLLMPLDWIALHEYIHEVMNNLQILLLENEYNLLTSGIFQSKRKQFVCILIYTYCVFTLQDSLDLASPVNDSFIFYQSKHSWFWIPNLWLWCNASHLNKTKTTYCVFTLLERVQTLPHLLMIALSSISLNTLGFGFPGCGSGVMLPTSTKPNPHTAFLLCRTEFRPCLTC